MLAEGEIDDEVESETDAELDSERELVIEAD